MKLHKFKIVLFLLILFSFPAIVQADYFADVCWWVTDGTSARPVRGDGAIIIESLDFAWSGSLSDMLYAKIYYKKNGSWNLLAEYGQDLNRGYRFASAPTWWTWDHEVQTYSYCSYVDWYWLWTNCWWRVIRLKFIPPDDLKGKRIDLKIEASYEGGGGTFYKTAQSYKPPTPYGVTASVNTYYDKVRVQWNKPDMGSYSNWYVQVYRNGAYLGQTQQNYFDDTNASPGVSSNYQVKVRLYESGSYNYGDFSQQVSGKRYRAEPPTNIAVSKDAYCDKVKLSWNAPNLGDFSNKSWGIEIYRNNSYLKNVGKATSFEDATAERGVLYNYKLRTQFTSGGTQYSDYTSQLEGRVADRISPPSNIVPSKEFCNKIDIKWDWKGDDPVNFGILKTESIPKSIYFDRINHDYITTVPVSNLQLRYNSFTIETWFKITGSISNTEIPLITNNQSGWSQALKLSVINQKLFMDFGAYGFYGTTAIQKDRWYHAAFVYNLSSRKCEIYLDGKLDASRTGVYYFYGNGNLELGRRESYYLEGCLDELRVWSKARTATEILSNMNLKMTGKEAGLTGCWSFDANATTDSPYTQYNTSYESSIAPVFNIYDVSGSERSYVFSGQSPNQTSYIALCAKDECGSWGNISVPLEGKTTLEIGIPKNLFVSKGYHSDKVELKWECDGYVDRFKIWRNVAGDNNPIHIVTLDGGNYTYNDVSAVPGIIYEYTIKGERNCETVAMTSDAAVAMGFREAAGIVTGHVEFEGGNAVQDVEVFVEPTIGNCLEFDGKNDFLQLPANLFSEVSRELSIEFWARNSGALDKEMRLFEAINSQGKTVLSATFKNNSIYWGAGYGSALDIISKQLDDSYKANEWNHWVFIKDVNNGEMKIYLNGKLWHQETGNKKNLMTGITSMRMCSGVSGGYFWSGILDEVRIWKRTLKTNEIARNYRRMLIGDEEALVAYWRLDENIGKKLFDRAKTVSKGTTTYHGFDADVNDAIWSDNVPPVADLHLSGYTDTNGNYEIRGIRYVGDGQTYTITPNFGVHKFQPGSRSAFISANSSVINAVDFLDISTFEVRGVVKYEGTSCFARDIFILVDGEHTNPPTQTDQNGGYVMNIPIGRHRVSAYAPNHEFSPGVWPPEDQPPHNFIQPITIDPFVDISKPRVIGRIVGGWQQAEAFPGKHKNNLGQAKLTLESQNGCLKRTYETNAETGGFLINDLPPLKYNASVEMKNGVGQTVYSFDARVLDMSINAPLITDSDSSYEDNNKYSLSLTQPGAAMEMNESYIDLSDQWTLECWFKFPLATTESWNTLFADSNGDRQLVVKRSDNKIGFFDGSSGEFIACNYDISQLSSDWHHVAVVAKKTENRQYYYIDGKLVGSVNKKSTGNIKVIGNAILGAQAWGVIDEIRVWNIALTQSDIQENMKISLKGTEQGLQNYYRCEKGSGTEVVDLTAAKMNGVLKSGANWTSGRDLTIYPAGQVVSYNYKFDYVYYSDPVMDITGMPENANCKQLTFPVYEQLQSYGLRIKLFETYVNYDKPESDPFRIDRVPVKEALLTINNYIGDEDEKKIQMNNGVNTETGLKYPLGDTLYTFKAGIPNFLTDATHPELSYTKTFDVVASLSNGNSANKLIRGYVVGAKARENNFVTRGPERVEMILRDPPGSGSSAFKSKGTTQSYSMSMEINAAIGQKIENQVELGPDFMAGIGVISEVDVTVEFTNATEMKLSSTTLLELNKTISFTETFSTSDDAGIVGGDADVFVGGSENYLYGMTDILKLNENCELTKTEGMYLVPKGFATTFIYTVDHIKNYLIPDLIMLRNNLFQRSAYISKIDPDNPMYGSNNDDPRWGNLKTSNTPTITETNADLNGPSYTFTPPDGYTGIADSIRWYNQQIRLWQESLSLNDQLKANAQFVENISFDANANYDQEVSQEVTSNFSQTFELGVTHEFATAVGVEHDGIGATTSVGFSVELSIGASIALGETKTVTTGFSLRDSDEGDYFSIDICHDPVYATPVFKTVAGQSMCPWEGPSYWMKDFNVEPGEAPNNVRIANGTMHREMPVFKVYPTVIENVPTNQPAVFNIQLGNASETDDEMTYYLRVLQETNPYGAVVAINGVIIENYMEYTLPAGATLNNTMTILRGPEQYEYENIKLLFYSPCEPSISDEISVTAKFIRDCTPVSIYTPIENWVVNTFNTNPAGKDTMQVKLYGYDIHDLFLQHLKLQYRPLDGNTWYTIEQFNKANWIPFVDRTSVYTSETQPPYIPGNFPTATDSLPNAYQLPSNDPYILYTWDVTDLPDKQYQLRAISNCELVENKSEPLIGILDRVKPHAFGTPQPTDGVLSSGEDIVLTLNEAIHSSPGILTFDNFDIRGILNGTKIDHSTSLHFDGADDYATVLNNYTLDVTDLTIEAWVNTQSTGGWQTIVMKGNYGYGLALDENLKLHYWNQATKENTATSEITIEPGVWTHVAFSTDGTDGTYYINGKPVGTTTKAQIINNNGDLYFGRSGSAGAVDNFKGFIHELRIWNVVRSRGDIASKMGRMLNGKEAGFVGYWKMDEGSGMLIEDTANDHHADIAEATWKIYPLGKSIELDGDKIVKADLYETSLENYTVEFWYKPTVSSDVPVLKITGAGEHRMLFHLSGANLECDFNHELGDDRGNLLAPVSANAWQHIALTWNGLTGRLYKDGVLTVETTDSLVFDYFHSLTIGDSTFTGLFDEIRFWKLARTQSQIVRYYTHRLTGQEPGLVAYYPFEKHNSQLVAETTLLDLSSYWGYETTDNNGCGCWKWIENKNHAAGPEDLNFADETPPMKIPRPVQPVAFEWSVRDNQIYINLLTPDSLIENCQLDVTVSNLKDLNGNVQAAPATWDVLIDRNPLQWIQQSIDAVKYLNESHNFSAEIYNRSGINQSFEVVNLPDWLTVTPTSGKIDPLKTASVSFTVHPGLNTGIYESAAYTKSGFGFEQKLPVNIRVLAQPPAWSVNESKYENSMNIVANVNVKNVTSQNPFDMIAAFVGDECRGVANVQYVNSVDSYIAFLNVYSNVTSGEIVTFKIWDSAYGVEYVEITPNYSFTAEAVHGSLKSPVALNATGNVAQSLELPASWKWISFNKQADDMSTSAILSALTPAANDQIKSQTEFSQYSSGNWTGSLATISNKDMYMVKLAGQDTLNYNGDILTPSATKLNVASGWNWISYVPNSNMEVNEALAYLNAATDDIIKSQNQFAIYDEEVGWEGTLTYMSPGIGYKLKVANSGEFIYPDKGMYLPSSGLAKELALPDKISSWITESENYQYNMTMCAMVDANDKSKSFQNVLAAFAGEECRGVSRPVYIEKFEKYIYFLMIHSNKSDHESFELRVFRTDTGEERIITESIRFNADDIIGTMSKPVALVSRELRAGDRGFIPREFMLSQNFPNPFNPVTKIGFGVPKQAHVTIKIYNIMGQEIITIFDEKMDAGYRYIEWNSTNDSGVQMASGMYFIKMISGDFVKTRKMTLLK